MTSAKDRTVTPSFRRPICSRNATSQMTIESCGYLATAPSGPPRGGNTLKKPAVRGHRDAQVPAVEGGYLVEKVGREHDQLPLGQSQLERTQRVARPQLRVRRVTKRVGP